MPLAAGRAAVSVVLFVSVLLLPAAQAQTPSTCPRSDAPGPELMGVRIGMTIEQAKAAASCALPKGQTGGIEYLIDLPLDSRPEYPGFSRRQEQLDPQNYELSTDDLSVWAPGAKGQQRVVGVQLFKVLADSKQVLAKDFAQSLLDKYGEPSFRTPGTWVWVYDAGGKRVAEVSAADQKCLKRGTGKFRPRAVPASCHHDWTFVSAPYFQDGNFPLSSIDVVMASPALEAQANAEAGELMKQAQEAAQKAASGREVDL